MSMTIDGSQMARDFRSTVLCERRHRLGGEALHALPGGVSTADQHVSDADRVPCSQPRDGHFGRAVEGMGLGRAGFSA